jgi:hypothetical protein
MTTTTSHILPQTYREALAMGASALADWEKLGYPAGHYLQDLAIAHYACAESMRAQYDAALAAVASCNPANEPVHFV